MSSKDSVWPYWTCVHEMSQYTDWTRFSQQTPINLLYDRLESNGFSTRLSINTATRSAVLCLSLQMMERVNWCLKLSWTRSEYVSHWLNFKATIKIELLCDEKAKQLCALWFNFVPAIGSAVAWNKKKTSCCTLERYYFPRHFLKVHVLDI